MTGLFQVLMQLKHPTNYLNACFNLLKQEMEEEKFNVTMERQNEA